VYQVPMDVWWISSTR